MLRSTHRSNTGNPSPTAHGQQRQPPPTRTHPHPAKPARSPALGAQKKASQIASGHAQHDRVQLPVNGPAPTTLQGAHGLLERRRERTAARKRRVLARWLRRIANRRPELDPIARRRQLLLHERAAAVRSELLEIAAMLEHDPDPDPASIAALHTLLANGCDSPLYNPDIHVSELRATLHHVRVGL
jgi:hypothetical protein